MTAYLIGACLVGGYVLGASTMAFILGACRQQAPMPPPDFTPPKDGNCRACIFVEVIRKQHAELCRAWAELEKR